MKKPMPYDFLLDYLPRNIIVVPAIGMFYIYLDKKIVFIFRKTGKNPQHNGIWISTKREHHASLKADVPAITDFEFEDSFDTAWLLLSDTHDDFESAAEAVCELVCKRDERIGKVTPKSASIAERNS
jgi:hypothetical protein